MRVELSVPDLSCTHCRAVVQGALSNVHGLTHIEVDLEAKRVRFELSDAGELDVALRKLEAEDYAASLISMA
jgi:copper chaperone CopZ